MRTFYLKAFAVLAGIWLVAAGIVWSAHTVKATPESVSDYVDKHPVEGKPPAEREQVLEKLARQMNTLDYDQRREVRMSKKLDVIFKALTPAEQGHFIDLTMPEGFKQMMDAFNKMEPEKRKAMVQKALDDMKKHGDEGQPPPDDPNTQKIIEHGLHAFYSEASAETKLDLSPLVEQMQHNMQGLH